MQWGIDRHLARLRLRTAALCFAEHGWYVAPGAWLDGDRFDCGRAGCLVRSCHPSRPDWADAACTDPAQIQAWWRDAPHAVLLATGHTVDVIEVPAALGSRAVSGTATPESITGPAQGPVAVLPNGQRLFLVRPGRGLCARLRRERGVLLHRSGSWVPLPPTRLRRGPVRWEVAPTAVGWRLPDAGAVQAALVAAVVSMTIPVSVLDGRREPAPAWTTGGRIVATAAPMAISRVSPVAPLRRVA